MQYYDPQRQAQVANVFAAQYGVQHQAREDEQKERLKAGTEIAKGGFFLDRAYRQEQENKALKMLEEESKLHEGGKKYVRKPYKKPESWREWLSQRYATPLDENKKGRGGLLQEAGYVDAHPEVQKQIKQLEGPGKTHILGKSGEVGPLSDPDTRHGKFDPEQYKTKMETKGIIQQHERWKGEEADIKSQQFIDTDKQIAERDSWIEQQKIKKMQGDDLGMGGGPRYSMSPEQTSAEALKIRSAATKSDLSTATARLDFLEGADEVPGPYTVHDPLTRYKPGHEPSPIGNIQPIKDPVQSMTGISGSPSPGISKLDRNVDTSHFEQIGRQSIQDQVGKELIQDRWKFGKQQLGGGQPLGSPAPPAPAVTPPTVKPDISKGPVSPPPYGAKEMTESTQKRFESIKDIKDKVTDAPETFESIQKQTGMETFDIDAPIDWDDKSIWEGLGSGDDVNTGAATGAVVGAGAVDAAEEGISVSEVGTGLKVGATLFGSQGMSNQELAQTGLEAGLDYASTKAITSGNPYLMAAGGAYKLYDFLT